MNTLNKTPIYSWHKNAGAKLASFAGWEMPISYTTIMQEHKAVRESGGLFDVSHMGQIFVEGNGTFDFIQGLITSDLSRCALQHGIYAHLCNKNGGVIDDIFVYSLKPQQYLIIVNAATIQKDFEWFTLNNRSGIQIRNESHRYGMVALQGPKSETSAMRLFNLLPDRHGIQESNFEGDSLYVCRTGYTGEDGFEFVVPEEKVLRLWERLIEIGQKDGIVPCGLGARDTLRLEAGYLLYGQDVDDFHSTVEAGPSWVIQWQKGYFIGKEALLQKKEDKNLSKLMGFQLKEKGVPRHGSVVYCNGKQCGQVTSGTFSPSLNIGIALAYVPQNCEGLFQIECSGKRALCEKARLPFYKRG